MLDKSWLDKPPVLRQFSTCGSCGLGSSWVIETNVLTVTHNLQRVELCRTCLDRLLRKINSMEELHE